MYYPVRRVKILSGSHGNTFGWVRKNGTKAHQGWDFQAFDGSDLIAVADGEIVGVDRIDDSSYGCSITLKFKGSYGEDVYAFYAHVSPNILVSKHDKVLEGSLIGFSGSTGNAKGSKKWAQHLHFEFREKQHCGYGLAGRIDPIAFFGDPPYEWIDGGMLTNGVIGNWYETAAPEMYSSY
jgi:murein DD-endopeptidase MepM/ murein hydrolase activator NlpD